MNTELGLEDIIETLLWTNSLHPGLELSHCILYAQYIDMLVS